MSESKSYELKILPEAIDDIYDIELWYTLNFSKETGEKVRKSILNTIETLQDFPNLGTTTPDEVLNSMGYRQILSRNHVIIYAIQDFTIFIYHVANTRVDYPNVFKSSLGIDNILLNEDNYINY